MLSGEWRPFCLGFNVLTLLPHLPEANELSSTVLLSNNRLIYHKQEKSTKYGLVSAKKNN